VPSSGGRGHLTEAATPGGACYRVFMPRKTRINQGYNRANLPGRPFSGDAPAPRQAVIYNGNMGKKAMGYTHASFKKSIRQ
jgi:hypothetical protein